LVRDDRSAETAAWVKAENSDLWLFKQIPFRDALKTAWRNCGITKK
jgi:hypothetical protein